jgi:hypothetical protein
MKSQTQPKPNHRLMGDNPLDGDTILERFYRPLNNSRSNGRNDGNANNNDNDNDNDNGNAGDAAPSNDVPPRAPKEKPTHYKVVCISLYNEDIERLESMVAELKRRGHTKANKSQLIRAALAQVDLAKIPKGF